MPGGVPGPGAESRLERGPSSASPSPWLWFPLLGFLALPCREQSLLGTAGGLLVTPPPTQDGERGQGLRGGGWNVLCSDPASRGE